MSEEANPSGRTQRRRYILELQNLKQSILAAYGSQDILRSNALILTPHQNTQLAQAQHLIRIAEELALQKGLSLQGLPAKGIELARQFMEDARSDKMETLNEAEREDAWFTVDWGAIQMDICARLRRIAWDTTMDAARSDGDCRVRMLVEEMPPDGREVRITPIWYGPPIKEFGQS